MKIQTFSIVIGTSACDADCPFCVSHTTGFKQVPESRAINWRNFDKAARLAQLGGTTTVLMTGKGEPTLYPVEIGQYLDKLGQWKFPFIEIQTNALRIGHIANGEDKNALPLTETHLKNWVGRGLNTIAISVVDVVTSHNRKVYNSDYPPLSDTVTFLHKLGYSVRLCVMMQQGMVHDPAGVDRVVDFCLKHEVAQLTMRPIRRPMMPVFTGSEQSTYVDRYGLEPEEILKIYQHVNGEGTHIGTIMHGEHAAKIFDMRGQNLCLSDCLTVDATTDDIRTLIFYADGKLFTDWQFNGARLL